MACERCCLKYEKPVSQLYTPHPPPVPSPPLPPPRSFFPPSFPFRKPNYFQLVNCGCTFQGRAREGTWLRRGPPLPSARTRGSAGLGRGRARRWVGLTLICWRRAAELRGGGRGRRRGWEEAPRGVERAAELSRSFDSTQAEIVSGGERWKVERSSWPQNKA